MKDLESNVVTGALCFTGKYIARRLVDGGKRVKTLTGHPDRPNPFGERLSVFPYNFDKPEELTESLRGASTLYNTYWIRFCYGGKSFDEAVENTKILLKASREAGIRRIVHISVANPSEDSKIPYFRAKALAEKAVINSGLSYAVVRPTLIFGAGDVLINNIAWLLRRFPVFLVPGNGNYKVQPVSVEDVAETAVNAAGKNENVVLDAVGPDVYTFAELVRLIASKVRSRAKIIHSSPDLALFLLRLVGYMVRDIVLTRDELDTVMANLLVTDGPVTGKRRINDWLSQNSDTVGINYASELARHFR